MGSVEVASVLFDATERIARSLPLIAVATLCALGNAILYAQPLPSSMSALAAIAFASITYRRWRAIKTPN